MVALFPRLGDSLGAGRLPTDLLLLSRRVLQGVLGGPALLHCERAARTLPRREFISARSSEHSPLLPLFGAAFHLVPDPRRLAGALVPGSRRWQWRRRRKVWDGGRDAGVGTQCDSAGRIHLWLSFTASPGGRGNRPAFPSADLPKRLSLRELLQSSPHALGLAESVLGRVLRSLRAAVFDGHLARLAPAVNGRAQRPMTWLKHQTPSSKHQKSSRLQIASCNGRVSVWSLELGISLVFGAWCLVFRFLDFSAALSLEWGASGAVSTIPRFNDSTI